MGFTTNSRVHYSMKYLSLFSGIEAASVAWQPLGWEPVGFSEVEPFCCALLAEKYPGVPNLGDITEITESRIASLGQFDLIVFGSPCQDLSVAGKRKGLNGERSGLFRSAVDIIRWASRHNGCRYVLWENVPGVFSSHQGADFSEVLRLFTGSPQSVPPKGWQTSGVAYGTEGLVEWRVLDAQFFGVPQRRRRVFAFLDLGEQPHGEPVLFERESLCRDLEACRASPESIAGPLEARTDAGGFPGTDGACANHVVSCFWDGSQTSQGQPGDPMNTLTSGDKHAVFCGTSNDYLRDLAVDQCPTLRSGSNGGVINPVCFQQNQRNECRLTGGDGTLAGSLSAESGMKNTNYLFGSGLISDMVVRRLTPLECERLQGLPDNWTKIPYREKPAEACPDTPRYRSIGNSMAVPVMQWIGKRIGACCD